MDRYDLAAQGSDNRLWDWDLTTGRIHFSPGWISMLGCPVSEFGNTPEEWFKRIHPEDLESVQSEIKTHLEKGSTEFEVQHRMLHQDGCYRWMSCRGAITRDDAGRALRITGVHSDITAEKVVDALTGLPNRLLLQERLTRSIEKAKKEKDFLFAVLILDLDLFDSGINCLETKNGDSLVIAAARRLETSLKAADNPVGEKRAHSAHLVARSGGEEFIILLDGLREVGEAKKVAEQLLKDILAPFAFRGGEVFLSASIGIALSVTGYSSAEEALRDADTALYRAKAFGKSRCEVFDTAVLEISQTQHQLEKDLQGALSRNEFVVFYQPIISLSSNRIAGFEALVRWEHPSRGFLPPMEFIPIAEKTGFIIPLDRWILQAACRQLKAWQQDPRLPKDLWVSVNLSSTQFMQPSLAKDICETLLEIDLDANHLVLELTEGAVMKNPEAARSLIMQLRVMGVRIALDDFGTGYSSLSHLRQLPLDYLKIDRSFIRSIENSSDTREIIRAISMLARQLGLRVIAEGIENSQQLDMIRSLNCEYVQGFLFSKAVGSRQAEALLLDGIPSKPMPIASPEKNNPATVASLHPDSDPESDQEARKKPVFTQKWRYALIGLASLVLLLAAGLVTRLNDSATRPVSSAPPPSVPAEAAGEKPILLPKIAETPPLQEYQNAWIGDVGPKPLNPVPKTAKKRESFAYLVMHDHHLGNCKGILKITRNSLFYVSKKAKDSFDLKYSDFSYALDGDRLTIRAGSKIYRFKSASAQTKDENQAYLLDIYQRLNAATATSKSASSK